MFSRSAVRHILIKVVKKSATAVQSFSDKLNCCGTERSKASSFKYHDGSLWAQFKHRTDVFDASAEQRKVILFLMNFNTASCAAWTLQSFECIITSRWNVDTQKSHSSCMTFILDGWDVKQIVWTLHVLKQIWSIVTNLKSWKQVYKFLLMLLVERKKERFRWTGLGMKLRFIWFTVWIENRNAVENLSTLWKHIESKAVNSGSLSSLKIISTHLTYCHV